MNIVDSQELTAAWRSFTQHVEFIEEEKCNYLMIWAGQKSRDVFNTCIIEDAERGKLKTYFDKFVA